MGYWSAGDAWVHQKTRLIGADWVEPMISGITHFYSPVVLAAACAIVAAGAFVQAGLGMGFGLTVAPLLALIDPLLVPVPVLTLGMLTASVSAWRERSQIVWREVAFGFFGRVSGVVLATVLLTWLNDSDTFAVIFGILVLAAVAMAASGGHIPLSRSSLSLAGIVSGVMGTITSVGSPPLALLYQARSPVQSRPTLSAFFALGAAVSLAGLLVSGWSQWRDVTPVFVLLPAMLAGMVSARRIKGQIDRRYRLCLLALAAAAALLLVIKGLA